MLSIITNINALAAQSALAVNQRKLSGSMVRLSTGVRINSAKDDSAGLGMSMRMTAEIRGLYVAVRNTHDAISAIQTADSGLSDISNALQRIRELAVQAATDTVTSANRIAMNNEASQMVSTIDQVVNTTSFNNIKLLDGSFQGKHIQIGTGNAVNDSMTVSIVNSDSVGISLSGYQSQGVVATVGSAALGASELTINTIAIGAAATASAKDEAAAINLQTAQTGVTAEARKTVSTSSALSLGAQPGDSIINLGVDGKLIAPVQVDGGDWYYYWDRDGSGDANGAPDATNHNILDSIFNKDVNGVINTTVINTDGLYGNTDIYRYGRLNGVNLAVPVEGGNTTDLWRPGTAVGSTSGAGSNQVNTTYDGLLAVWDAYNGTSMGTVIGLGINGIPSGWYGVVSMDYLTATLTTEGHSQVDLSRGVVDRFNNDNESHFVALQVLPNSFQSVVSGDIQINGINIGAIGTASSASARSIQMVTAINAQTANTGVAAAIDSTTGGVTLSAADGRNIEISTLTSTAIASNQIGISLNGTVSGSRTVTTIRSAVDLYSATNTSITIATSGNGASASGLSAGVTAVLAVSRLDLTTGTSAGNAITTLDASIRTISNTRSSLGAYENALTHIGDNLDNMSMNMSASRSRILDTEYAIETSDLARSQILSQASTAILAQANQNQKNTIMALIK